MTNEAKHPNNLTRVRGYFIMTLLRRFIKRLTIKRLRSRLLLFFALALIVPGVILGYTSYNSAKAQLQKKLEDTAESNVKLLNQTIDQIIGLETANMKQLALQIASAQIDKKDAQTQKLIDDFMKQHPELEVLTLGNNNGAWMKSPDPGKQEYDPRTRDWYKALFTQPGKPLVSDPTISVSTKNVVVIIGVTLPDGKGAIGVNLSLSKLNDIVKDVKFGTEGYAYVLDRTNKYLSHPTQKLGDQATGEQFQKMQAGKSGSVSYELDGETRKAFYTTNEQTGWKIAAVLMNREFSQAARPILVQTAVVLAVAIIVMMLLLTLVINRVTRPIEQLSVSATRVREGHLNEKVITKRQDEIGVLAENYNAMVASLRGIVMDVSQTSSLLAASSEEMAASAEENTIAVEHVNEMVQDSARKAEDQARAIAESAGTMEEMSVGIVRIAESAGTIVESSNQTAEDVEIGSEKVRQVSEQMAAIRQSVEESAHFIETLHSLSAKVTQMTAAISAIAGQTNILSLNAGIEAVRAGEQGRGFAVVAGEVRKLAEQSKLTAGDIEETLSQMTSLIVKAAEVMTTRVTADVEKGARITEEARAAFDNIQKSTRLIVTQIHEVSAITQQMSASAQEVSASVQEMSHLAKSTMSSFGSVSAAAQQQLASMEEIASSTFALSKTAEEMQRTVERFKW